MNTKPTKARPNTLLILLTMFDLIAAAAGAAPFAMAALISGGSEAAENSNFALIISVPAVAVLLVLLAWAMEALGRSKAARITAGVPIIWGMVVLVMLSGPSG